MGELGYSQTETLRGGGWTGHLRKASSPATSSRRAAALAKAARVVRDVVTTPSSLSAPFPQASPSPTRSSLLRCPCTCCTAGTTSPWPGSRCRPKSASRRASPRASVDGAVLIRPVLNHPSSCSSVLGGAGPYPSSRSPPQARVRALFASARGGGSGGDANSAAAEAVEAATAELQAAPPPPATQGAVDLALWHCASRGRRGLLWMIGSTGLWPAH